MRTIELSKLAVLSTVLSAGTTVAAEEEGDRLQVMKAQFEELRADAFSAQEKFNERYEGELKKLEDKATGEAMLDLVLKVREEAEVFRTRKGEFERSDHAELAQMQDIFGEQTARLKAERATKLATLFEGYKTQLTELQSEFTKASKIDEALLVQTELKRIGIEFSGAAGGDPRVGSGDRLAEILTSRQWVRYQGTRLSGTFEFAVGGAINSIGFKSSWNRWKVENETIKLSAKKTTEFQMSATRPYSLTCKTPGIHAHTRLIEVE